MDLAERLGVCARLVRGVLGPAVAGHGLSESQLSVLVVCQYAPPSGLGQNELAAALAVSPALVSTLVEQLRAAGLLRGRRAPSDRRRQVWRLTGAGEDVLARVAADLGDWAAQVERHVGEADLLQFRRVLGQLVALLRRTNADAGDVPNSPLSGTNRKRRAG